MVYIWTHNLRQYIKPVKVAYGKLKIYIHLLSINLRIRHDLCCLRTVCSICLLRCCAPASG